MRKKKTEREKCGRSNAGDGDDADEKEVASAVAAVVEIVVVVVAVLLRLALAAAVSLLLRAAVAAGGPLAAHRRCAHVRLPRMLPVMTLMLPPLLRSFCAEEPRSLRCARTGSTGRTAVRSAHRASARERRQYVAHARASALAPTQEHYGEACHARARGRPRPAGHPEWRFVESGRASSLTVIFHVSIPPRPLR